MLKIIPPGSYHFDDEPVQLVKVSSRGLQGIDRQRLIKRASAGILEKLARVQLKPGEELVHIIAVGATERYNANRNGDGFRIAACKRYHPTFKKYAKFYRSHKNRNPKKSYGVVKESFFNDAMSRIELLVALNATKEAADRNEGLVADEELEKLASGKEIPTSMSCLVPFDVCSSCGNKAKTRAEYCDESMCKHGGLKHNIGKVCDDGHVLHADNTKPKFFDISHVFRPADRISYVLGRVSDMEKAASCTACGAELADRLRMLEPTTFGYPDIFGSTATQLLAKMAAAERQVGRDTGVARAFEPTVQPPAGDYPDVRKREKLAHVTRALADANCLLPITDFLALMTGMPAKQAADVAQSVRAHLPGIFSRLLDDPDSADDLANNPYTPSPTVAPTRVRQWVAKHARAWSLDHDAVIERIQLAVLRDPTYKPQLRKVASHDARAEILAREYALYELAFLQNRGESADAELTRELVIRQNDIW